MSPDANLPPQQHDQQHKQRALQVLPAITTIKGLYDNLLAQGVKGWSLQLGADTLQCCYKVEGLSLRISFFLGPPAPLVGTLTDGSAGGSSSSNPAAAEGRLAWQHSCEVQSPATGEWLLVDTAGAGWEFAQQQLVEAGDAKALLEQFACCCMCCGCNGHHHAAISRARGHLWKDEEGTTHASFEEGQVLTSSGIITSTLRAECCVQLLPPLCGGAAGAAILGSSHKKRKGGEGRRRCGSCSLLRMRVRSMRPRLGQDAQP
jgi:hypothetical protein